MEARRQAELEARRQREVDHHMMLEQQKRRAEEQREMARCASVLWIHTSSRHTLMLNNKRQWSTSP